MKLFLISLIFILSTITFADNFKLATSIEKDTPSFNALQALLKEIFKRAGNHTVEFETLPAERALLSANAGEYDGDASRVKDMVKPYSNLIEIPTPITRIDVSIYTTNPKITSITPENAKNYSVIYMRGSKAAESLLKMFTQEKINVTYSDVSAFKMLIAGRADILLETSRIADEQLKTNGIKGVIKLPTPLFESSVHLILNKKHSALVPALDKALQDMEKDGSLTKLMIGK